MLDVALIAAALPAAVLVLYIRARLWPYVPCSKCGGTGQRRSPGGEAYGRCRKCKNLDHLKERRRLSARIFGTGR